MCSYHVDIRAAAQLMLEIERCPIRVSSEALERHPNPYGPASGVRQHSFPTPHRRTDEDQRLNVVRIVPGIGQSENAAERVAEDFYAAVTQALTHVLNVLGEPAERVRFTRGVVGVAAATLVQEPELPVRRRRFEVIPERAAIVRRTPVKGIKRRPVSLHAGGELDAVGGTDKCRFCHRLRQALALRTGRALWAP